MLFYDHFYRIIILCIWCNRICWHDLMLKKHIIFQILYIIVGPLCPASLKRFVFYKVPPSDKHSLLWLANWHSGHHKHVSETNEKMNEWMMHFYSALLRIVVHPKCFTIMGGGGGLSSTTTSVQHPLGWCDGCHRTTAPVRSPHQLQVERRESHRANQVYALTTHQLQVERRESHRANQVYALTTHQLQVERRESHRANQVYALTTHQLQVERRESHRANQVYALTTHQLQVERRESHRANQVYALTTHQLQVERRESHRANQVDGDY